MRLCYVLLSPTFGMHQYTADLANRMAHTLTGSVSHDVCLVTTTHVPRCRYAPAVVVHTPMETTNTGLSRQVFRLSALRNLQSAICNLHPDVVHFTGPHLWNAPLIWALVARGVPVIHTLHDLDPHRGVRYSLLIRLWNRVVMHSADHILVHGQTYRQRLLAQGMPPHRVTWTPLLHLFLGSTMLAASPDLTTGRVIEPGHPATLARCLDEMLSDPARLARMGAAGRAWYDARRATEERTLIEMYLRLANKRPLDDPITQLSSHPV